MNAHQNYYCPTRQPDTNQTGSLFKGFAILFSLLVVLLLLSVPNCLRAQEEEPAPPGKMIFLPFTVKTDTQQQHLQDGLTDILASRMTNRTGLIAVHRSSETRQLAALIEKGDQQAFKDMLKKMKGDYLVIGSLEQQDTDYEIMIYVFNRRKPAPSSFSKKITTLDRAIPAMDELSIEIAAQVFNKQQPELLFSSSPENEGVSGFQTAHPDRAFREGLYRPATILGLDGDEFKVLSTRRSRKISTPVRAMDVGDLDGDGTEEIVLVEHGNMTIYRFSMDHFQHVADQPLPNHLAPHAVNLADLDGNGLQEIYITANSGDKPSSQVFEWDGSTFHTLFEDVDYYIRPGLNWQGKEVLIGQMGSTLGPVGRSFYQLVKTADKTLDKTDKIEIPRGFNLHDFIIADLDQDGAQEFVGITTKNHLVVMDQAGKPLWKSEAGYGASKAFLGTLSSNRPGGRTPTYMHTRLITRDQDSDGKPELIVGRNRLTNVKFMKRLRYFEGSSISGLSWDGSGMTTLWETKKIPGYTTDYQVVRGGDRPDHMRLFFVESSSSYPFFFWESEESIVHLYEMGRKSEKTTLKSEQ